MDSALDIIVAGGDPAVTVTALRKSASQPGADVPGIAREIGTLSAQLAVLPGWASVAAEAQQAAVDVLRRFTPSLSQRAAHLAEFADALHTLALRFIAAGRAPEAVTPADQAADAYRQLATTPGADALQISRSLLSLSSQVASAPVPFAGLTAAQAAVDLLHDFRPTPEQRLFYLAGLAEALHTLVLRFIAAGRAPEAVAPADEAVRTYREVAAGATDRYSIATQLQSLSSQLASAALDTVARDAQQAAVDLLQPLGPPPDRPALLAEALHGLAVRLVSTRQLDQAGSAAEAAMSAYGAAIQDIRARLAAVATGLVPVMKELVARNLVAAASEVHRLAVSAFVEDAPGVTPGSDGPLPPLSRSAATSIAREQIVALRGLRGAVTGGVRALATTMDSAGLAPSALAQQLLVSPGSGRFCGTDDVGGGAGDIRPLTFGPPGGRWTRGNLTVSIVVPPGPLPPTSRAVIMGAFQQWQNLAGLVAGNFFQFRFVPPGTGEDIRVTFDGMAVDPRFGSRGGVMGVGAYPPSGTLRFDNAETWNAASLLATALHEIGHILGLSHSNAPGELMYPFGPTVSTIDAEAGQALAAIYGWAPQSQLPDRATSSRASLGIISQSTFTSRVELPQMVWKGAGSDAGIFHSEFAGGVWTPQQQLRGFACSFSPALAQISGAGDGTTTGLLMAWRGGGSDQGIFWTRNVGNGWEGQRNVPLVGTSAAPTLAALNGRVTMAWKGIHDDTGIFTSTFDGVGTWSPQARIAGVGTSAAPALVAYDNQLYLFWKGLEDDNTLYYSSFDPALDPIWKPQRHVDYFTYTTSGGVPHAVGTTTGPSVTRRGDAILLTWKGAAGDNTIWTSLFRAGEFSGQVNFPNAGTSTGPSVIQTVSRTTSPLGGTQIAETTFMAWKGSGDDNTIWWSRL